MCKYKCLNNHYTSFEYGEIYQGDETSYDFVPVSVIAKINPEDWEIVEDEFDIYQELRKIGLTSDQCCEVEDLIERYLEIKNK